MVELERGRRTVDSDAEVVVFLIGMRVNRVRAWRAWLPVAQAMPRMLRELADHPELGLLDARSWVSGRTVMTVQYWASFEQLTAFARGSGLTHLPAWRAYNRRVADSAGAVGIFHETYRTAPGTRETIYGELPPTGLGRALGTVPIGSPGTGQSAARRMDAGAADVVAVPVPS